MAHQFKKYSTRTHPFSTPRLFSWVLVGLVASGLGGCDSEDEDGGMGGPADDDSYEAPAGCKPLLDPLVGRYEVSGAAADHARGTILVHPSGAIDFDEDIAFEADEIMVCYDRTQQDHARRVQVSYGADDDGPVINLYLSAALEVESIEFRHRNESVEIQVPVGTAQAID